MCGAWDGLNGCRQLSHWPHVDAGLWIAPTPRWLTHLRRNGERQQASLFSKISTISTWTDAHVRNGGSHLILRQSCRTIRHASLRARPLITVPGSCRTSQPWPRADLAFGLSRSVRIGAFWRTSLGRMSGSDQSSINQRRSLSALWISAETVAESASLTASDKQYSAMAIPLATVAASTASALRSAQRVKTPAIRAACSAAFAACPVT